jgi:hypothetical protein
MKLQRPPPLTSPPLQSTITHPTFTPVTAAMKAPITAAASHSRPPCPPPNPIKGYSHSGGAPHPFTSPPSLLNCARAVPAWSQSFVAGAPPPRGRPSSGERSLGCAASRPSRRHPRGKPPWPGATARPSSDEPRPSATVESMVEPWTGHPGAVHELMDLVHGFSFRKTIPENSNFWHFCT